jgi:hypothetical protein
LILELWQGWIIATEDEVRAIALSLPGTTEEQWYQTPGYKVAGKGFLRIRTEAEGGLVVCVSDLGEKEAMLSSNPDASSPRRTMTDIRWYLSTSTKLITTSCVS